MTQLVYPTKMEGENPLHFNSFSANQERGSHTAFFLQNVFDKARNTIKQARENQWWLIQNIVYANNFTLLPFVTYDKNVHTLVTISEDTFLIRVSFKYNKWHIKRFFGQRDTQIEPTKTPPWLAPSTEIFKICDSRYSKNALPGSVCS